MSKQIDLRGKHADQEWQQGACLTSSGYFPSGEVWAAQEKLEQCKLYVNSNINDIGQDRQLIYMFNTPEECAKEVEEHNKNLKVIRLLMPKKPDGFKTAHYTVRGEKIHG